MRGKEAELMHPQLDAALTASVVSTWKSRLLQIAVCLGCLATGAALVVSASPRTPLNAGSTPQESGGESALLDFTATWCGPCQQMSPIVDRLAQEGYPIRKVDVDRQRALAERYQITSMPTFVLVVNGREVMRQSGMTSEAQLRRMLREIPNLQQEIAAVPPAKPMPRKLTSSNSSGTDDFGPSPFAVELGNPAPVDSLAAAAPRKKGFGLPFFQRDPPATATPPASSPADPIVRAQSGDGEIPAAPAASADPMQASTRLRVKDAGGMNFGSGTIIESRVGRTVILTCGHIFRQLGAEGIVEVDVFLRGQKKPITYVGKVIQFDLETDIGLVAIPTSQRVSATPLASIDQPLLVGDSLFSIGCGGGDLPTREAVEVTAVNKYTGPENIECTGEPIQGRSGGGLFRGKELVGVCIAADPKDRRGVFTALGPIYSLIEKCGFGHLLPVGRPAEAPVVAATSQALDQVVPEVTSPFDQAGSLPGEIDLGAAFVEAAQSSPSAETRATQTASAADLQSVLGQAPDSEVICIVRPKNPQIPSRVVIIHEASPKLIGYLLDSFGGLPSKPNSLNDVFNRTNGLVPTTAVETLAPSPFSAGSSAPAQSPAFQAVAPAPKPHRPTSPR